jgi:hypothetical protein
MERHCSAQWVVSASCKVTSSEVYRRVFKVTAGIVLVHQTLGDLMCHYVEHVQVVDASLECLGVEACYLHALA